MKKLTIVFALAMLIVSQVSGQHIFNNAAIANVRNQGILTFTLPSEANVIHYRVEASNDDNNYEILGIVASKGNSVFERTYNYKLYNTGYKYYRVGRVGMNGSLQYSQIITAPVNEKPDYQPVAPVANNAIANGK